VIAADATDSVAADFVPPARGALSPYAGRRTDPDLHRQRLAANESP
jgi:hypothetical protein